MTDLDGLNELRRRGFTKLQARTLIENPSVGAAAAGIGGGGWSPVMNLAESSHYLEEVTSIVTLDSFSFIDPAHGSIRNYVEPEGPLFLESAEAQSVHQSQVGASYVDVSFSIFGLPGTSVPGDFLLIRGDGGRLNAGLPFRPGNTDMSINLGGMVYDDQPLNYFIEIVTATPVTVSLVQVRVLAARLSPLTI